MLDQKEHVNIIYPEEGKRYRLNVRTAVGRLSVGKVKQCLAAASSCPIPLPDMVLHLNGVPLSNDRDLCESLGIGNGATLSVEARAAPSTQQQQQQPSSFLRRDAEMGSALESDPFVSRARSDRAHTPSRATTPPPPPPPPPSSVMSEQRRLLELQTLEQQDAMLHKDVAVRDDILRSTLHHVDDEMDQASLRRRQLERQRENAEEELRRMHEKEAAAAAERQRLATLRAQEAARATARAAELAERREQMRAEQEATRAVSLLKLENEKKKATLAQQKSLLEAERERALLEQDSFEAATKVRELELRSREIDMEHQRLARIREARALEADRRMSVKQRLHYYERLGVEPPRALQREAATLLMRRDDSADDDESEAADAAEAEDEEAHSGQRRDPKHSKHSSSGTQKADRVGLVQSRGPSHASVNATASPSLPRSPPHHSTHKPGPAAAQQQQQQQQRSPSSTLAASSPKTKYNSDVAVVPDGGFYDARENAEENLRRLGDDLGLSGGLAFDDGDTCVISIDGAYTLLVTYDAATERLYLYSTLLAALPPSVRDTPEGRLRLYEFLLEASLLGREMCGGGVGASMRNNFVLMSASLYMPTSQPWSLRTLAPQFMHCLQHWRGKLTEFLQELERGPALAGASPQEPQHGFWSEPPPVAPSAHASSSPPSRAAWSQQSPQQQQQQQYSNYNGLHGVSPSRSPVGSVSPSQASPSQARDGNTRSASKVIPVLGLEVTGTVLVNGMPTHYDNGVLVVNAAGPSVLAGIQPNDFVEELNGVPICSVNEFRRVIEQQLVPGMLVPIRINRGGVAMIVTVRVEAAWSL